MITRTFRMTAGEAITKIEQAKDIMMKSGHGKQLMAKGEAGIRQYFTYTLMQWHSDSEKWNSNEQAEGTLYITCPYRFREELEKFLHLF